ncbi:MAG: molybdenum ABC transporter ATP-binding protein [Woeseiaceae bacterium]
MISLRHKLTKGDFVLDVDAEIPDVGITGIFGESGSGKTTLLRCIAGLERGSNNDSLPVHKRNVGYVFQDPGLFPHLTVRGNIEYGARRATTHRVDSAPVVDMLGIGNLLNRKPASLSGGEAQRVAIAAALLRSPDLVLMDEPLASLDRKRRDELLPYFDRLHDELSVPVLYVSHDIDEISRLCDHLVLLDKGRVAASGDLFEVVSRVDVPMLSGRNAGVVLWATPVDHEDGLTKFDFGDGDIWAPGEFETGRSPMRLRISARDVSVARERPTQTTILNVLRAVVEEIHTVDKAVALLRLGVGNQVVLAQVTNRSVRRLDLRPGERVFAQVKSVTVRH